MNMISTGAFQNEMDASNKQPTIAEKFAAVWEKKNAKAARAGGVSLMALSLAACGSSDDDTTTSSTDTTSDTTTTTVAATNQTFTLTTGMDLPTGGAGNDTFSAPLSSSIMTYDTLDTLDGGAGTDTLVISSNTTGTAMAASVTNIENIIFAASAAGTLSLQGASGYENVEVRSTTADNTISNIAAGTNIAVTNVGDQTITFSAAATGYTGTADVASGAAAPRDSIVNAPVIAEASTSVTCASVPSYIVKFPEPDITSLVAVPEFNVSTVELPATATL